MTNHEMERRVRTAVQIANYGLHLGLLPYQIDEAVCNGMKLLDEGKSSAVAYEVGRNVFNRFVQPPIELRA